MQTIRRGAWVAFAGLVLLSGGARASDTSNVTIVNTSDWVLTHFFMSPVDEEDWGVDQLGAKVVGKGEKFTLTGVPCDLWDLRIIDEDGDECVVTEVDLCAHEAVWSVTNDELLGCEAETEEE